MDQWYVLHTKQGQEAYAESLVQKKISPSIYSVCRVLKKKKIFRSGGVLHIFGGCNVSRSICLLQRELQKSL